MFWHGCSYIHAYKFIFVFPFFISCVVAASKSVSLPSMFWRFFYLLFVPSNEFCAIILCSAQCYIYTYYVYIYTYIYLCLFFAMNTTNDNWAYALLLLLFTLCTVNTLNRLFHLRSGFRTAKILRENLSVLVKQFFPKKTFSAVKFKVLKRFIEQLPWC